MVHCQFLYITRLECCHVIRLKTEVFEKKKTSLKSFCDGNCVETNLVICCYQQASTSLVIRHLKMMKKTPKRCKYFVPSHDSSSLTLTGFFSFPR